jgi:hypothetical protein
MKTLEEALPVGVVRALSLVESETGLARSTILTKGVSYRAANDSVVRGIIAHKGFVEQKGETPAAPAPAKTWGSAPVHSEPVAAPGAPHAPSGWGSKTESAPIGDRFDRTVHDD